MKDRFGFVYLRKLVDFALSHFRELAGLGLVIALVLFFIITLNGRQVSMVFSTLNSGLDSGYDGAAVASAPAPGSTGGGYPMPGGGSASAAAAQANADRLVIKNATLSLEVQDVAQTEAAVHKRAGELGGYVLESATSGAGDEMSTKIVFRVPVERFNEALAGVEGLASKLRSRAVQGNDITEEFVDLEARLRNLELTRDRLRGFLDQSTKVADALTVNSSLSAVQGEIEQIQGRVRYLQQSAAFSTITVELTPIPLIPIVSEEGWQPVATARASLRDVIALGQWGIERLIVVTIWLPVWAPLALVGWWFVKRARRGDGQLSA